MTLGLLASALVTQRVKFWLPDTGRPLLRTFLTQSVAFWTGAVITWMFWRSWAGAVAGMCVGIASPTLYAIFVRVIGIKFPDVRDLLSKDDNEP
jgi:hypothetical protein